VRPSSSRTVPELFDDYEESFPAGRLSAPFLYEREGKLSLHFDIAGVQSLMDTEVPNRLMLGYTRTIMGFLLFNDRPRHIGMVGLGGGSLPKYCYKHLPQSRISVAEISPEVIAVRERFLIPDDNDRFHVICEDGGEFVKRHADEFDVLIIDGFDSAGQPPELCSQEFYLDCCNALTPAGILVVNICDSGRSMLIPRLRRAFQGSVIVVNGDDSTNTIAFAGDVMKPLRYPRGHKHSVGAPKCTDDSSAIQHRARALQDWSAALSS
jgi:spermidine synthase